LPERTQSVVRAPYNTATRSLFYGSGKKRLRVNFDADSNSHGFAFSRRRALWVFGFFSPP
jgi:hypothetical protein